MLTINITENKATVIIYPHGLAKPLRILRHIPLYSFFINVSEMVPQVINSQELLDEGVREGGGRVLCVRTLNPHNHSFNLTATNVLSGGGTAFCLLSRCVCAGHLLTI